jgi:(R,R)-butanediol dehydrogenase / meso-butanediol dehydrogenase / diacetyl reductase
MRAALYYGPGDVRIETVADPAPGPGEVLIRPLHNGLCGTDLHQFYDGPMSPAPLPIIVGHECAGEVVELGVGAGTAPGAIAVGDLVAVAPLWTCGDCTPCSAGFHNLCEQMLCHGMGTGGGGLAEYTVVREKMTHKLPDGVSATAGALAEPLSVAYHAVRQSRPEPGQPAVVFGAGPIGIGCFLGLRAMGVDEVIVVEPAADRRAAASAVGASTVLDPAATDVVAHVLEQTKGAGVPVSIDAAGAEAAFRTALRVTGRRGRLVPVAAYVEPFAFNPSEAMLYEIEIVASFSYNDEFDTVLGHLAAGRYPTDAWVEHVPFDTHTDAYERMRAGSIIKAMVDVQAP